MIDVSALASAEHMTIFIIVIGNEKIPCNRSVVHVRTQTAHHLLDVIAFIDEFIRIILFAVILAHVGILETFYVFLSQSSIKVNHVSLLLVIIQLTIFLDFIERVLTHNALTIKAFREAFEILGHELWICFIPMDKLAYADELVIILELGDI